MDARTIRAKKEVRALFWPWCAVMIAGAAPLVVSHEYAEPLSYLSFFFGIPLLATLSLGNEFYHRTLSLWLTQPLNRMQLWREKMMVMLPAVLSAGLVSGVIMFAVTWPDMRLTYRVAAVVYVVVSAASATFLTLATRSTLGGLLLISGMLFAGSLFSGGTGDTPRGGISPAAAIGMLGTFGLCFSALMLWLGVRKLARFQVTGGGSEVDLMVTGPAIAPEALAELFRPRPSGAFLNLVRKEFRLLRPLWVIGFLVLLYVACLAVFRLLPAPPVAEPRTVLEWILLGPLVAVCVGLAGLAGILSLGEERMSGTQTWHMTLPISAGRQWLLKLVMALFAGLCCSLLFPVAAMMAGGAIYGSPRMYINVGSLPDLIKVFVILTFTCFWCACAANGTVRAAIWAVPVTVAVTIACAGGLWLGERLVRITGTLGDLVISRWHLNPITLWRFMDFSSVRILWLFVPALLVALVQSYWLFRTPPKDGNVWMLRRMAPVVAVTVLWTFSIAAGFAFSRWQPFYEMRDALNRLRPMAAPVELGGEELAKMGPISPTTRRWLEGARIAVTPDASQASVYHATSQLASGTECKLIVTAYGGMAPSCDQGERR